jgi:hypothetical protein
MLMRCSLSLYDLGRKTVCSIGHQYDSRVKEAACIEVLSFHALVDEGER